MVLNHWTRCLSYNDFVIFDWELSAWIIKINKGPGAPRFHASSQGDEIMRLWNPELLPGLATPLCSQEWKPRAKPVTNYQQSQKRWFLSHPLAFFFSLKLLHVLCLPFSGICGISSCLPTICSRGRARVSTISPTGCLWSWDVTGWIVRGLNCLSQGDVIILTTPTWDSYSSSQNLVQQQ